MIILGAVAKNPNVETLQRALNALAVATGDARFQVTVDGFMGPITMTAALASFPLVLAHVSDTAAKIALVGLAATSITNPTWTQNVLQNYASQLSKAILAYIAAKVLTSSTPPTPPAASYPIKQPHSPLDPRVFSTPPPSPSGSTPEDVAVITAFDPKLNAFRIARMIMAPSEFSAGVNATHIEIGMAQQAPAGAQSVTLPTYLLMIGKLPWYQKYRKGLLIGGVVLGVGVGAFTYFKKG